MRALRPGRVLPIPPKRSPKPILEFLSTAEADALLAAPAKTTWTGIRDHALLALDSRPACASASCAR